MKRSSYAQINEKSGKPGTQMPIRDCDTRRLITPIHPVFPQITQIDADNITKGPGLYLRHLRANEDVPFTGPI
jgi:hypothetical protein